MSTAMVMRYSRTRHALRVFLLLIVTSAVPAITHADPVLYRPGLPTSALPTSVGTAPRVATVVIIIDDIGNQMHTGLRAIELPGKITLAILPHTANSKTLANLAAAAGKEVILHSPMSNVNHKPLGPGALTADMSEQVFRETLARSIASTPHIRGVSNHMGSQLTGQRAQMGWLMEELGQRGLYFVDSRTSINTVAAHTATEHHIPNLSRQVFLDNEIESAAIAAKFEETLKLARRTGLAVAIGHPHGKTLDYLQMALPELKSRGYRLALVSEVVSGVAAPGFRLSGMGAD